MQEVIEDAEIIIEDLEYDETSTPRQQHLRELRALLVLLENNPSLQLPSDIGRSAWSALDFYPSSAVEAAKLVRALGGKWSKNDPNKSEFDASYLVMHTKLGRELHVKVVVSREGVCEKKVIGTEKRKVEKVVVKEVREEVYEDVDVIKFECKSLMSLADQKVMDELEAVAS